MLSRAYIVAWKLKVIIEILNLWRNPCKNIKISNYVLKNLHSEEVMEKGDKLNVKLKGYNNHVNSWINKKI